jgi:HSP20 family protein
MSLLNSLLPSLNRQPAPRVETPAVDPEPTIKPVFDLSETPAAWTLAVMLPGVAKDGVELTVDETQIKVSGRRTWRQPAGWTPLYRETSDAAFALELSHDNAVAPERVAAEMRDGVLKVTSPKHAALQPRRIAVA